MCESPGHPGEGEGPPRAHRARLSRPLGSWGRRAGGWAPGWLCGAPGSWRAELGSPPQPPAPSHQGSGLGEPKSGRLPGSHLPQLGPWVPPAPTWAGNPAGEGMYYSCQWRGRGLAPGHGSCGITQPQPCGRAAALWCPQLAMGPCCPAPPTPEAAPPSCLPNPCLSAWDPWLARALPKGTLRHRARPEGPREPAGFGLALAHPGSLWQRRELNLGIRAPAPTPALVPHGAREVKGQCPEPSPPRAPFPQLPDSPHPPFFPRTFPSPTLRREGPSSVPTKHLRPREGT